MKEKPLKNNFILKIRLIALLTFLSSDDDISVT